MSSINNNDSDPSDPSTNPYNPYTLQGLRWEIDQIMAAMKSGKNYDPTLAIAHVLGDINGLQGNIVSSDAATQVIQSGFVSQASGLQACIADTDGTPQPDVNPYTGETLKNADGTTKMVSPEKSYADRMDYINNSIHTKFKQDSNGNEIPVTPPTTPATFEKNKIYEYYNDPKNKSLLDALTSNLNTMYSTVSGTKGTTNSQSGTPGYTFDGNGKLVPGTGIHTTLDSGTPANPPTTPPTFSKPGVFQNLWNQVKGIAIPPTTPEPTPNPGAMQPLQSAMGTLSTTLTSGSSAIEAVAKVDAQSYQTGTGVVNSTLMGIISFVKALVKGQTTQ